jgi:sialate O-acetylesterase
MNALRSLSLALLASLLALSAPADVALPAIFSDHAVLRRADQIPIWGTAAPGEVVTVALATETTTVKTGTDGKWSALLNLSKIGAAPLEMTVTGQNRLTVRDVLVGEVWLASGQSNMAYGMSAEQHAQTELPKAANPLLRFFSVARKGSRAPEADPSGKWQIATPESSRQFSAVGYYFGQRVQRELGTPVGVICSAVGGSVVQAWTSADALATFPDLKNAYQSQWARIQNYDADRAAYPARMQAWVKTHEREDKPSANPALYAAPDADTNGWRKVKLGGLARGEGLPKTGVIWLRKEFAWESTQPWPVIKILIDGSYVLYLNGVKGREVNFANTAGNGEVLELNQKDWGAAVLNPGKNVLAIRLYQPDAPIKVFGSLTAGTASLAGEWLAKAEHTYPDLHASALASRPPPLNLPPVDRETSSALYNAMIHPLIPYSLSGVIWYQGEGNKNFAWQYRTAFPLLIQSWRKEWGRELPFYFCQMHSHYAKEARPIESEGAELREAQTVALSLPNTGMSVNIDLGEEDIHPRNKKDVADRLAAVALVKTYGKVMPYSGPVFAAVKKAGAKLIVSFTHTDGGLVAKPLPATRIVSGTKTAPLVRNSRDSQLEGFAICGADKKWVWAQAKIAGETVEVWSDAVSDPLAVRYGWAINPTVNLYNGAGLPAGPFRTDDFPAKTLNALFGQN